MVLPARYENYGSSPDDTDASDRHEITTPRPYPHGPMLSLSTIIQWRYDCGSEVAGEAMLRMYYGGEGKHRREREDHLCAEEPQFRAVLDHQLERWAAVLEALRPNDGPPGDDCPCGGKGGVNCPEMTRL